MTAEKRNRENAKSIEKRRRNALIERVNKEAGAGWETIQSEFTRAILDHASSIGPQPDPQSHAEAKAALIQTGLAKTRAAIARAITNRKTAFERSSAMVPTIERARDEIAEKYTAKGFDEKHISDNAIADWLNDNNVPTARGERNPNPEQKPKWTGAQVREVLFRGPERMITHSVLECRTRMSAAELSADFTKPMENMTPLEQDYLKQIAEALDIYHRLEGNRPRTSEELMWEAKQMGGGVAAFQRAGRAFDMLEREALWRPFEKEKGKKHDQ